MVSAEMTCVKYLLFCFNLLFVISGIVIITVGVTIQATYYNFSDFVDASYVSAPIVLIVVGVIIFGVAFFGCYGAIRENHCMMITFSMFIILIFSMELAAGIGGYVRHNEVEGMLTKHFNKTILEYKTNKEIQKSWNSVQHDFKCCGINNKTDWEAVYPNGTLPYTCCENLFKNEECTEKSESVYQDSCLNKFKNAIENKAYIIGGVGIGVALIQLIGVGFACSLARSIRKEYETV